MTGTRRWLFPLVCALIWPSLGLAQDAWPDRPIPMRDVAPDSRLGAPRETSADLPIFRSGRWRLMLSGGPPADDVVSGLLTKSLAGCAASMGVLPDEVAALAATNRWAAFDAASRGQPLLLLSLIGDRTFEQRCADSAVVSAPGLWRGLQLPTRGTTAPQNDPRAVQLFADGRRVEPALVGRTRQLSIERARDEAGQLRLYIPMAELAPDRAGNLPALSLVVATADSAFSDTVAMPSVYLREAWMESIRWRLAGGGAGGSPRLRLPAARDSALQKAQVAYAGGDVRDAGLRSLPLASSRDGRTRRAARLLLGEGLLASGDSAAARLVLREALLEEPCLSMDASVSQDFRRALDPLRPAARCETRGVASVFLRGLLFPGSAQLATSRWRNALPFAAITVIGGGLAVMQMQESSSAYSSYKTATTAQDAVRLYKKAEDRQAFAQALAMTAAASWLAGAIEGAVMEKLHRDRMRELRPYGGNR